MKYHTFSCNTKRKDMPSLQSNARSMASFSSITGLWEPVVSYKGYQGL